MDIKPCNILMSERLLNIFDLNLNNEINDIDNLIDS